MVNVRNIYYMLAYAYEALEEGDLCTIVPEQFDNVHDLFAAILIQGVSWQIKRGLNRSYALQEDSLPILRGRLDIGRTVRRFCTGTMELVCCFDEFTEDNSLNRILKATMLVLLSDDHVRCENRRTIRKLLFYFTKVRNIFPAVIHWDEVQYNRNNQSYRLLIGVCELVIKGLLLSRDNGGTQLRDFLDDVRMHQLYERFVRNFYRRWYPYLSARAEQIAWNIDEGCAADWLPAMKSDITLTHNGRRLIIDTKYYNHSMQYNAKYDKNSVISGNLYQIYTYVKNKDRLHDGSVEGMLLYAKTDDLITADGQVYQMDGNKITIRCLDLSAEWERISLALKDIVENWIA